MRNKVAVVGANGFISKHLIEKLRELGNIELQLFGRSASNSSGLPYSQIDYANSQKLSEQFANVNTVYYLASETIPATSWDNPLIEIERNLIPFLSLMEVVSRLNVKKVAFVSSAGTIYGPTEGKVNESADKQPFSPYGITKLTMESYLNYYHVKYGINYDVYRVSNVYGEGQNTSKGLGIINTFLEKIISVNRIDIFGDGSNTRNYIYVKDVASLLTHSIHSNGTSGIYNISSNDTVSISQLVKIIKGIVKEPFEVNYLEGRKSDNSFIDLDNSKILKCVGAFNFTSLEQGIAETYEALKKAHLKVN